MEFLVTIVVANDDTSSGVRQRNQTSCGTRKRKGFSSPITPSKAANLFSDRRLADSNRKYEKVKREKRESEPARVSGSVTERFRQPFRQWGWRLVVSETEDCPYHPENEGSLRVSERSFVHENVVAGVVGHHKVMAGECGLNEKARLRTFCYTKWISQMNGIILNRHRERIQGTPFKWCLDMQQPLKICNSLLLELLKRWLPAQESFRVMQRSIPFTCADICMSLGLSVVGLDVDFDKTYCGVVGGLLQDRIVTVETIIEIIQGLVGSDSNEVDNTWAVERLSLCGPELQLIFPRILAWPEVHFKSRRIKKLFQESKICGEWRLREEDKQNIMIREALQLGDEAKSEKPHRMIVKRRQWTLRDYGAYFRAELIVLEDILSAAFRMIVKRRQWTLRDYGAYFRAELIVLEDILSAAFRMIVKRRQWTLRDYGAYFRAELIVLEDILSAAFLFAPIVHDDHWWCYVVNCQEKKLYVLDSIGHSNKIRKRIDNVVAHNLGLLFGMLMKCSEDDFPKFEVHCEITPIQPNLYDYGIIVLQMMDLWDGQKKFDGNTMPNYTNVNCNVDNIYRQEILQYYDALL
ncbi:Ulp1 protease family [Vigna unguiculata]|uniref:Ulp1 protease family n=1 Tax=Vigna unguiculata TaxID=3917 RepID=A0A4D6LE40_VIGUN|nr:Ulp1 protease family [Vigna unguiculata]